MAIFPKPDPSSVVQPDVDEIAIESLQIASSPPHTSPGVHQVPAPAASLVRGTSVSLAIDLDVHGGVSKEKGEVQGSQVVGRPKREPIRRDSLKRREALLKGKEGSRRRRQWENDRLLNNPWAQPPLPSDWEVHPTYPRHAVPYYLAPMWERDTVARVEAREKAKLAAKQKALDEDDTQGRVPRNIREKMKKAKAAKGLLKDLEEQVRSFVSSWDDDKGKEMDKMHTDSEDEEIVFVGRNGHMHDVPPSPKFRDSMDSDDIERERLVFDSLANDQGASFGRWLVHSIASYYGLRTWSVTVGNPARREAYVAMPLEEARIVSPDLPRPLWGMV